MSRVVSIEREGRDAARAALESCVLGGGVAVFPADGLYGLACDPLSASAIERIHSIKGRDDGKPSAVLYFSGLQMRELFGSLGPRTRSALGALLPGALTLVVANPEHRYPLACREDPDRLGLRLIAGPLEGARCALLQTSANRSGEPPASRFELIDPAVIDGADLAIDGGSLAGSPSTVVDLTAIETGGGWSVLREGAVPSPDLERLMAAISVDPAP